MPLRDGEVQAAFANLVWHHLADHDAAAREVFRVLGPGGRVVVSDLLPHEAEWMRDAMGDLRLGLRVEQVLGALEVRDGDEEAVAEHERGGHVMWQLVDRRRRVAITRAQRPD